MPKTKWKPYYTLVDPDGFELQVLINESSLDVKLVDPDGDKKRLLVAALTPEPDIILVRSYMK